MRFEMEHCGIIKTVFNKMLAVSSTIYKNVHVFGYF